METDNSTSMEKKTSKEWEELIPDKYKLAILDPDGWDRKNYQFSFYEELITKEEFNRRLSSSTIHCNVSFLQQSGDKISYYLKQTLLNF